LKDADNSPDEEDKVHFPKINRWLSEPHLENEVCRIYAEAFTQVGQQLRPNLKLKAQLEDIATAVVSRGNFHDLKKRDGVNVKDLKQAIRKVETEYENLKETLGSIERVEYQNAFKTAVLRLAKERKDLAVKAGKLREDLVEDVKWYLKGGNGGDGWD
jgi:hypothetical protein